MFLLVWRVIVVREAPLRQAQGAVLVGESIEPPSHTANFIT